MPTMKLLLEPQIELGRGWQGGYIENGGGLALVSRNGYTFSFKEKGHLLDFMCAILDGRGEPIGLTQYGDKHYVDMHIICVWDPDSWWNAGWSHLDRICTVYDFTWAATEFIRMEWTKNS